MTPGQDHVTRLREETFRALEPRFEGIEKEIRGLYSLLLQTFGQIEEKLRDARDVDFTPAISVLTETFQDEIRRQAEYLSSLEQFVSDVRQLETQEEILLLLLDRACTHAPRLALFTTRGERIQGWSSRGYDADTATGISSYTSSTANPLFARVLGTHARSAHDDLCDAPGLAELLSPGAKGPWHFFPMRTLGRSVALLVATGSDAATPHPEMLSLIIDFAGLRIENLALRILREVEVPTSQSEPAPAPPEPRIVMPRPLEAVSVPPVEVLAGEATEAWAQVAAPAVWEVQPSVEPPAGDATPQAQMSGEALKVEVATPEVVPSAEPAVIEQAAPEPSTPLEPAVIEQAEPEPPRPAEPLAAEQAEPEPLWPAEPHAVEHAEPEPSWPAEPFAVEHAEPEPLQPAESGPVEVPARPVEVVGAPVVQPPTVAPEESPRFAEEERLHSDAKRFARLLVSEIKLYNEQRVLEGRENRDIYVRLKRDIDRSREMYQKRVSPAVSRKVDYFHDELIRILGDNDPSHLGSDYPGPLVES